MGGFCNFRLISLEIQCKICLFALNPYLGVNHCIEPCRGIVLLINLNTMAKIFYPIGFDENGNPCDYVDEQDIHMYCHGKGVDGSDNWCR